jgi:NO-binding membrane sensor protein with MHYT domain/nitrogen-specific signal transduction histidine kinase
MFSKLFATPLTIPLTRPVDGFFIHADAIPVDAELGTYSIPLVVLSYVIVTIASYVAMDIAGKLSNTVDRSQRIKIVCGALAMGAGIWSMHFVGMLAYKMRMELSYDPWITAVSMLVAILFAGAAFTVIKGDKLSTRKLIIAAPLLGIAVSGMHYIGMQAMEMDAKLLYRPDLFILSFLIATTASAAALKIMFHAKNSNHQLIFNLSAAMIMGGAVCGMHYTGMSASVFLPYADCRYVPDQDFSGLAASVSLITFLIVFVAYLVKQLDEALKESQARAAQLFQAQKMEAVGQLTGGIAHDFNNMLGIIMGNLELLSILPGLPARAETFIKTGMDGAKKASDLTHRLLAFSRNQVLQAVPSDLNALIPSALILAKRAVEPTVLVSSDVHPDLPTVLIDPINFESSLLNLILNARDAMPQGGEIMVTARTEYFDPEKAKSEQLAVGKYIAVSISDTGSGMSDEVIRRATEPFFTTKGVGKGSGMGLSMVYGFARQSGGTLAIKSQLGKGSTVTIYLPSSGVKIQKNQTLETEEFPLVGNERVLIVDDEIEIRNIIETSLLEAGYRTQSTSSGEIALSLLRDQQFDLLITDVLMPQMNGYQLAEQALSINPQLQILFISGFVPKNDLPPNIPREKSSFLAKPFSLSALAHKVRNQLSINRGNRSK